MAQSKNEFYLRRIHSLLGIIPIGAFLVVHLLVNHQATQGAEAFNKAFYGKEVNYDLMHETLQHPGWAIFYIICIIAVVFHFANGLWSFLVTWGGLQSPKSQRVFTWVSLIVFLVISYIGVTAIIAFM
ncbi:hypothetical protein L2T70_05565 [Staphylococcus aureus]|nr:hypothetical protein [Staphylococcus aureus]